MFYRPAASVGADVLLQSKNSFTQQTWRSGLRPDQRGASQLRELQIDFPLATRDLVQVQLGGTVVTASVKCELVEPSPFRPKHGFLDLRVRQVLNERDSSSKHTCIKRLSIFLDRLIKGNVLDTESLCVLPGKRAWAIVVEVVIMNDDGNARDAAQWALMCVLQHTRRPELTIRGDEVTVHSPQERDPVPLSMHHTPICFTYAVTLDPQRVELETRMEAIRTAKVADATKVVVGADAMLPVVVDPSAEETSAAASTVVVAVNVEGQVCAVEKGEGCPLQWTMIEQCMTTSQKLAPLVLASMKDAMERHDKRRSELRKGQFLWATTRAGVSAAPKNSAADAIEKSESFCAVTANDDSPATKKKRAE